jgi:hypothetical protein
MKSKLFLILLIIFLSGYSIFPLFNNGFFESDDGEWMIIRFSAFYQTLSDGQFPVRFLDRLYHGYGYPVSNFLYPGFMYAGSIIKVLGFGFVDSIKILLGFSMLASAVFAFLWLNSRFGKWASFAGAIFYVYAPYHLFDLYKRGSVGEIFALGIVPFIFWQIERRSFFWTSIGISTLILAHNTLSLLFLFLIFAYLVFKGLPWIVYLVPTLILGIGIVSFFWIPAIFDLQYTVFHKTQISEWRNYFAGFDLIGIGIPIILFLTFLKIFVDKHKEKTIYIMSVFAVISLFLSISASSIAWSILPVSFIQFPFRFLSLTIFASSFLLAFILSGFEKNKSFLIGIGIIVVTFLSSFQILTSIDFYDKGEGFYATNQATTTVQDEYLPVWVKNKKTSMYEEKIEIDNGAVFNVMIKSNEIKFQTESENDSLVTINSIYFPGWKVLVNGENADINYMDGDGLIKVNLPSGSHSVEAELTETRIRLFSDTVSVLFLLGLIVFSFISFKRKRI